MAILHPALWTLLRLRQRGRLRQLERELGTLRGALLFLLGLSLFGLAIVPLIVTLEPVTPRRHEHLVQLYPFALLMIVLAGQVRGLADRAIYFTPSEVDALFPGPFHRWELLVYRILSSLPGMVLTALVSSLVLLRFATSWPAVFVGVLLSLILIQLLGMTLALLRETVEARLFTAGRRVAAVTIVGLLVAGLIYVVHRGAWQDPGQAFQAVQATWPMRILLAPFVPFAEVVAASTFDEPTLVWLATCLAIDASLLAMLFHLDANYLETAAQVSERLYRRAKGIGGGRLANERRNGVRLRLAPLPTMEGVGLVAWMQLTVALRSLRILLETALLVTLIGGLIYLTSAPSAGPRSDALGIGVGVVVWVTLVVSNTLRFDLRGHLEHMAYLKTLPLAPWAIVLGELVAPVLVTTLFQLPFAALWVPYGDAVPLLLVAVYALPGNLLLYAVENLIFLLLPMSPQGRGPGDFQFMGRQMLLFLVKIAAVGLGVALAATVGGLLYWALGPQWRVIGTAAWLVSIAEVGVLIWLLAGAFRRFDPSRHAPPEG